MQLAPHTSALCFFSLPLSRRWGARLFAALCGLLALSAGAQNLPSSVEAALARAKLPTSALSMLVVETQGTATPRLAFRATQPMNPASVMKLVTTYAALDQLGPSFSWKTPVYVDGTIAGGVLSGNLYIKGLGDPKLVAERLWLLLRRVQALGIHSIRGDIVLDRSAFEVPPANPADFDGEPLRPYNAAPDALLLNFKAVVMGFSPNAAANNASIAYDLPLAGVHMQAHVPLGTGECGDWRTGLKADFSDPLRLRFAGSYPSSCGERMWPLAYAEPPAYAARALEGLWRSLNAGTAEALSGSVREGRVPAKLKPVFEVASPSLAEVVRDINKYSNNVMAQQVFLTLSLQAKGLGSFEASRELVRTWWRNNFGEADMPVLDNGSGLSRNERISAQGLARLLQLAWASPLMPELMASLPIAGVDGTLKRSKAGAAAGAAHLKTGSLSNVAAIAGYVDGASGKRYVLVAIANHANATAARPAFDALLDWAAKDQ